MQRKKSQRQRQEFELLKICHSRKIKMPKEVNYAPGAKLPQATVARRKTTKKFEAKKAEAFPCNHFTYECNQNEPISYQDFSSVSTAILKGTLTTNQFKVAQLADPFCARIMDKVHKLKHYKIIKGLLFFKTAKSTKLVMPSLLDIIINAKHFSVFGLHFSKTRILRDISCSTCSIETKIANVETKLYHLSIQHDRPKRPRIEEDRFHLCTKSHLGHRYHT